MQSDESCTAEIVQNDAYPSLPPVPIATATYSYSASISSGMPRGATGSGSGTGQTIYSYCVSGTPSSCGPANAGYDSVGKVLGYSDSFQATWSFSSDSLNRLISGTPAANNISNKGHSPCLLSDSFSNRTAKSSQGGTCPPVPMANATYSSNNRVAGTTVVAASTICRTASKGS